MIVLDGEGLEKRGWERLVIPVVTANEDSFEERSKVKSVRKDWVTKCRRRMVM
jgi:hypothetical protein